MSMTEVPTWTLQERLRKAREHAHLTRFQMAERLGVTERTIRNWENGRVDPTRGNVLAYSAVTHVPVVWITGEWSGGPESGPNPAFIRGYTQHRRPVEAVERRILQAA